MRRRRRRRRRHLMILWLFFVFPCSFYVFVVQKHADMSDYGYLLLVAMATSCAVLFAVIVTAACVVLARRHRLRHHHHETDSVSLEGHQDACQGHQDTCPHSCSLGQLGTQQLLFYSYNDTVMLRICTRRPDKY